MRGLLLDVGGVLVGPAGGRWNPRFDFESVVLRHLPSTDLSRIHAAVAAGDVWLTTTPPPHERSEYHRAVLAVLGIDDPPRELLADLEAPAPGPVFEAYADVVPSLDRAKHAGLRFAVVTDSWGTSETKRAQLGEVGLDSYFEAIVVSHELGCTKPDPRMFDTASALLGLARHDCLVVDDVPSLVRAAIDLGYHGVVVNRDGGSLADVPSFADLAGVISHLEHD